MTYDEAKARFQAEFPDWDVTLRIDDHGHIFGVGLSADYHRIREAWERHYSVFFPANTVPDDFVNDMIPVMREWVRHSGLHSAPSADLA